MKSFNIKFRRVGRWKKPVYSIVVTFKKTSTSSGFLFEKLGFYSTSSRSKFFFLNYSRFAYWLMRGAAVSNRLGSLLAKSSPITLQANQNA